MSCCCGGKVKGIVFIVGVFDFVEALNSIHKYAF